MLSIPSNDNNSSNNELLHSPSYSTTSILKKQQQHQQQQHDSVVPLSHLHVTWSCLPSIRKLCPELFTKIQLLYNDLVIQEERNIQIHSDNKQWKKQFDDLQLKYNTDVGRLLPKEKEMGTMIEEFKYRKELSNDEMKKNLSARTTMEQIRMVLTSTPGGLNSFLSELPINTRKEFVNATPTHARSNVTTSTINNNNWNSTNSASKLNAMELQGNATLTPIHLQSFMNANTNVNSNGSIYADNNNMKTQSTQRETPLQQTPPNSRINNVMIDNLRQVCNTNSSTLNQGVDHVLDIDDVSYDKT